MFINLAIKNFYKKYFFIYFFYLVLNKLKFSFSKKNNFNNYENIYLKKSITLTQFLKKEKIPINRNYYKKLIKKFSSSIDSFYGALKKFSSISGLFKNQAGPGNLILLDILTKLPRVKNVLETGVGFGFSSSTMLPNLIKKKGLLTSVDIPYLNSTNLDYLGLFVNKSLKKKWNLIIGLDYYVLKKLLNKKKLFDLVVYDSDKSYYGRLKCYYLMWEMLNDKGYFVTDDVNDNDAFIDFAKEKNAKYIIIKKYRAPGKYSGIIIK